MLSNNILNNFIYKVYDDYQIYESYLYFQNLFSNFENLNKGDKIGLNDKINFEDNPFKRYLNISAIKWEIYIDESSYVQFISRWYYSQNRYQIIENILTMVKIYKKYLSYLELNYNMGKFLDLKNKIKKLNENLIKGLSSLSETYNDDIMKEKINEIIYLLIN